MHKTGSRLTRRLIELIPSLADPSALRVPSTSRKRKHLIEERQKDLARLIVKGFRLEQPHNVVEDAVFLTCKYLRNVLHCRDAETYTALLRPYFEFPEGLRGYDAGRNVAKWFRLRPDVAKIVEQALLDVARSPLPKPASSGPLRHSTALADELGIPAVLSEVTLEHVARAITTAKQSGDFEALSYLMDIEEEVSKHNGLPNVFSGLQQSGRLAHNGAAHLVATPSSVRQLLLRDLGWWDYDLRSCHLSILRSLGQAYDFPTWSLDPYLFDKATAHIVWAKIVGHDKPKDFKRLVLSFLNGATLSSSPLTELGRTLGREGAEKWVSLPMVRSLYKEIRAGTAAILEHTAFKHFRVCSNATGATLETRSRGEAVSHILNGYEQWAIREICKRLPTKSLRTVIYDGWIMSEKLSDTAVADLEDSLAWTSQKKLGVELRLSIVGATLS